jgi:hypothetical protein
MATKKPKDDDDDDESGTKDRKFGFCSNNRGDKVSNGLKNRTGRGEKGTSELCRGRKGKFEVRPGVEPFGGVDPAWLP